MWVKLGDTYFETDLIAAVRPAGLGKDSSATIIHTAGQSAVDSGYLIEMPIEKVMDKLRDARLDEIAEMIMAEHEAEEEANQEGDEQVVVESAPNVPEPTASVNWKPRHGPYDRRSRSQHSRRDDI